MEPRPSAPIVEEALDEEDDPREDADADELEELELTRLVAERIAEELRELDCAPLELETVSEPSAATVVEPPPEELPLEVPAAREATVVFELREALNDRLSRPNPDREPCNCGARSWEKCSAPVEPVRRKVLFSVPLMALADRISGACLAPFSCADAWRM
ncbi:MAG: hypothetical protein IT164_05125 [Bryobacterales bacterium]|nr:hypothetical protein [Bryobacterales bacterium]